MKAGTYLNAQGQILDTVSGIPARFYEESCPASRIAVRYISWKETYSKSYHIIKEGLFAKTV